jgi:hypothetical protein
MRVITFSRQFPKGHPKEGQPTYFVEKIWNSLKIAGEYNVYINHPKQLKDGSWRVPIFWRGENHGSKFHTIRAGNRWKVGDMYSPRVWSGKPYGSKQVEFAPPIRIEKVWEFGISKSDYFINDGTGIKMISYDLLKSIARNDGLELDDFECWFALHPKKKEQYFTGQILCHNPEINY